MQGINYEDGEEVKRVNCSYKDKTDKMKNSVSEKKHKEAGEMARNPPEGGEEN